MLEARSSSSWTIPNKQLIIRKFINSAIYVEKEVVDMRPQRKTSTLSINDNPVEDKNSYPDNTYLENRKICSNITPESGYRTVEHSSNSSNEESDDPSESTVKPTDFEPNNSELRLSLTCLNTNRTCTLDPKERQEIVQNWMAKKEMEKKRKVYLESQMAKQREENRQLLIEKERENFKKWLADKKKEEERRRAQRELEAEEGKLREAEKEKKKVENDINYNLWLRKKKKDELEKKITEKLALLRMYEEKQKRMEENERAYQEWLSTSKTRQKPIPFNKGLQSLCSSASVTYINPIPWTPNIDMKLKPASQ